MKRSLEELEQAASAWDSSWMRKQHAEAEVALCDPENIFRTKLIELTKSHPRFADKYTYELRKQKMLADHECCSGTWRELEKMNLDVQNRVRLALALDCEMVETVADNMALARVSVVDVQGNTVLDVLVLPCEASFIEDCRTTITGIEKDDLVKHGISVEEARKRFARICCKDTVLIGHALDHDLLALKFNHDLVIDTSHLFPVLATSLIGVDEEYLHSLDYLSNQVLRRDMDRSARGGVHDSLEDSRNSLDLVKYALLGLRNTGFESCPPIPSKARRFRRRGPGYGFAGSLQGRQSFASQSYSQTIVGKDDDAVDSFFAFYDWSLESSSWINNVDANNRAILHAKPKDETEGKTSSASEPPKADAAASSTSSSSSNQATNQGGGVFLTGTGFYEQQRMVTAQVRTMLQGRAKMDKLKAKFFGGQKKRGGRFP